MNTLDLRIGNYVQYHELTEIVYGFEDGSKFIHLENDDQSDFKDVRPIPLDEKWLIDFGFELKPYQGISKWCKGTFFFWDKYDETCEYSIHIAIFDTVIEFKYVHELQNYYYWTFKEELILKANAEERTEN